MRHLRALHRRGFHTKAKSKMCRDIIICIRRVRSSRRRRRSGIASYLRCCIGIRRRRNLDRRGAVLARRVKTRARGEAWREKVRRVEARPVGLGVLMILSARQLAVLAVSRSTLRLCMRALIQMRRIWSLLRTLTILGSYRLGRCKMWIQVGIGWLISKRMYGIVCNICAS